MRVLMLSEHCCARVVKQGLALKKRGVEVHYMQRRISNPAFMPSMDFMSEYVSDEHLAEKLSRLNGYDLIHVHNEPDSIGVVAKQVRPDLPVIFDAHDLFSVRMGAIFPDERFVFSNCDGFIFPSEGYQAHARETHNFDKPSCVVYSMPNEDFITDEQPALLNAIGYEGGLRIPETFEGPDEFKYHSYRDFRETFRYITKRLSIPMIVFPANVDIMNDYQDTGPMFFPTLDYVTLMKTLPALSWGLVGGPEPGIKQWDTAMPNKLFEFIAAGVPIISINGSEIQQFVERWQVGVSLDSLDEIPSILGKHQELRRNVYFLQRRFTMENEVGKVVNLYREVTR